MFFREPSWNAALVVLVDVVPLRWVTNTSDHYNMTEEVIFYSG